jgi:hypothetical protein
MRTTSRLLGLCVLALVLGTVPAFAAATIVIVNNNAPGVGFNDSTPAAPWAATPAPRSASSG